MVRDSTLYLSSSRPHIQESWKISHTHIHTSSFLWFSVFSFVLRRLKSWFVFPPKINEFCWLTWEITGRFKLATWKVSWTEKRRWCGRGRRGRHRICFGGGIHEPESWIHSLSQPRKQGLQFVWMLYGCCMDAIQSYGCCEGRNPVCAGLAPAELGHLVSDLQLRLNKYSLQNRRQLNQTDLLSYLIHHPFFIHNKKWPGSKSGFCKTVTFRRDIRTLL